MKTSALILAGLFTSTLLPFALADEDFAGPARFTSQTGTLFFGHQPTPIQIGEAFFTVGNSGFLVGPNCPHLSTCRPMNRRPWAHPSSALASSPPRLGRIIFAFQNPLPALSEFRLPKFPSPILP